MQHTNDNALGAPSGKSFRGKTKKREKVGQMTNALGAPSGIQILYKDNTRKGKGGANDDAFKCASVL